MSNINKFLSLLESGNDNALLRYSLGNEYFKINDFDNAIIHLDKSVELNPDYSAAWKMYAKALVESGQKEKAIKTYEQGISVAKKNGDMQVAKEMNVFLNRLQK